MRNDFNDKVKKFAIQDQLETLRRIKTIDFSKRTKDEVSGSHSGRITKSSSMRMKPQKMATSVGERQNRLDSSIENVDKFSTREEHSVNAPKETSKLND